MKTIKVMLLLFVLATITGCEQIASRNFGGDITITLKPGVKLVDVKWSASNLWYLTEPMDSDYVPKTKVFKKIPVMGVLDGTFTFIESK